MTIVLNRTSDLTPEVSSGMFGGNALFHRDDVDDPQFTGNVTNFGLTAIRWPGGSVAENWFDPANPDVPLASPRREVPGIDRDDVFTFSEAMSWSASSGRPLSVVLPSIDVLRADGTVNRAELDKITSFVKDALSPGGRFADGKIEAFELGNEYWSDMSSREYGRTANLMIKAVEDGIAASGSPYDPKILVQIGETWGPDYDEGGENYGKVLDFKAGRITWSDMLREANADLISELDPSSRASIDGLVQHFYTKAYKETDGVWTRNDLDNSHNVVNVARGVWANAGMDLGMHMTEWNIQNASLSEDVSAFALGGMLVESFESMMRAGTESAYVWPVNQNTFNDLGGGPGTGPGHMTASGAAFKLLSENVSGLSVGRLDMADDKVLETSLFVGEKKTVLFISRDDGNAWTNDLDLRGIAPADPGDGSYLVVTEKKVVRDPTQDPYVDRLNGDGTVKDIARNGSGARIVLDEQGRALHMPSWDVSLAPYEVSMIVMEWVPANRISSAVVNVLGTADNDVITGTLSSNAPDGADAPAQRIISLGQRISSLGGNDTVFGGSGDDTLIGGTGSDSLVGSLGNDSLIGEAGHDSLNAGDGNDVLNGGDGNDVLNGGNGDDLKLGGAGDDRMVSGAGNDTMNGNDGRDVLYGGEGADLLYGAAGNDWMSGESGADDMSGGSDNDTLLGGAGNDVVSGEDGHDALQGGAGADKVFGGAGNDVLYGYGMSSTGAAADDNAADLLVGGGGNDTLYGGGGNDRLAFGTKAASSYGGNGIDLAYGGAGADVFQFGGSSGYTDIRDFQDGVDRVQFMQAGVDGIDDLTLIQITGADGDKEVRVEYADDYGSGVIRLASATGDLLLSQITDRDFIF